MKLPNPSQKSIVLGLTLLAFLLRAYRLEAQSYWLDEIWTVYFANFSWAEMWRLLQTTEAHPPFYHPSTIPWLQLAGDSEYAMRFYSLVFGVMAVPLAYRLGKSLGDNRLGLIVALLMCVAPYQIWHSQEARMYSLLTASSIMSMWGFVNLWQRGGRRWQLVYVLGTLWAIASHYHGLALIGIQGLFVLLTWRRRWRNFLTWAGALVAVFLLYLPWLIFSWDLLKNRTNWVEETTLWNTYIRSAIAYSVGEVVPRPQAIYLTLVFVAIYGLGLIYAASRRWGVWRGPEMPAFLLAYTIAPNLAAWLYGELRATAYLERYLIAVQVGYLLAVSIGVLAVADGLPALINRVKHKTHSPPLKRMATLAAVALLLLLVGVNGWVLNRHYFDPLYAKPNWRGLIRTIENFDQPGDAILLTGDGGEKLFNYYYRGNLPVYFDFNTPVPPPDKARQLISAIAKNHRRIWFTPYGAGIDAVLEEWLANNAYPAWHSWLGRKRLALYSTRLPVKRQEILNAAFVDSSGQGPTLTRVTLPNDPTAAGDTLPLSLTWQTDTSLARDYQLSLRLINNRGDTFTQSDWPPLSATGGTSTWSDNQPVTDRRSLWLPPDTPPGSYLLQLVLYDPSSGQSLGQPAVIPNIAIAAAKITPPPDTLSIPNQITNYQLPITNYQLPITIVGYALPPQIQPGQEMWLWLYWILDFRFKILDFDSQLAIRLSLSSGNETIAADYPLADALGPLDSWQPGQVRRAIYHLPTSPRLAGKTAQVKATLLAGQKIEAEISIAQIKLATRPRQFTPPAIAHPLNATFGDPPALTLLGYDLPPQSKIQNPKSKIAITLYWQAQVEMKVNYTVFVQMLNDAGQVVAQVDLQPQAGAAPTVTWLPGEILTDPYTLALPPDLPPGEYRLIAGLYNAATGERLPVTSGGNFVELQQITVK